MRFGENHCARAIWMVPLLALLASCATAPSPAPAPPRDVNSVIDRIMEAYGGKATLAKVQAYAFAGSLEDRTNFHSESTVAPFRRLFARPDSLKVSITRPEGTEVRIVQGAKGWRNGRSGGEILPVTEKPLMGMQLQAARAAFPWILEEKRSSISLAPPMRMIFPGEKMTSFRFMEVLLVPLEKGMVLRAVVDPENWRVVGLAGYLDAQDPATVFETHFYDFASVEGVLFPRLEVTFAGKVNTGTMSINNIQVNPPLAEGEFNP